MNNEHGGCDSYAQIIDKARWSHAHGRNSSHITQKDINTARLFSYAYRSQCLGTFYATRVAIEAEEDSSVPRHIKSRLSQVAVFLKQLEDKAVDVVPRDCRVLISTLYYYDLLTNLVVQTLDEVSDHNPKLGTILQQFLENLAPVTADEIYTARDVNFPAQGNFFVPGLGIHITPIIYGDHHSWNAALLSGNQYGVSVHRHAKGAEIHLGFTPLSGQTILGSSFAEVSEGYAMPIPPMTDHGFFNISGHDHVLPFVFGSLLMSGWGVFFDVEPQPEGLGRAKHLLDSCAMNQSLFLERALRQVAGRPRTGREVVIPAERAGSPEIGGLELAITHVGRGEMELSAAHYRIVSVQSGRARICIGDAEKEVRAHDHFGVPADMSCCVKQSGTAPLLLLDSMLLPITNPG